MIEVFLYGGILLIVLCFILFIAHEMNKRKLDREQFKSDQLTPSFNKGNVLIMKKKK
jgi:hypothetical protein